jgi:hypothetical protein
MQQPNLPGVLASRECGKIDILPGLFPACHGDFAARDDVESVRQFTLASIALQPAELQSLALPDYFPKGFMLTRYQVSMPP